MEVKKSELFDRFTILLMKSRLDEAARKEATRYSNEIREILQQVEPHRLIILFACTCELMEANAKIWMLEAAIRKEFKNDSQANGQLELQEIGRRALAIREQNIIRTKAKHSIDDLFQEFPEPKFDHASAKG